MSSVNEICVVVAARNAAATVRRAIISALRQAEVSQVIVVDDASGDETSQSALDADDGSGRLLLVRLSGNVGPAAARNQALAQARVELVCVLDADDWVQDGRFGRMLASGGDHWDLLADDLLLAAEGTPELPAARMLGLADDTRTTIDLVSFIAANIPNPRRPRQELGYLKPLMRRSFLEQASLRYDESLRLGEDYSLYAQALVRGARLVLLPACGYVAVARAGSLSRAHGVTEIAALLAADERLIDEARQLRPDAVAILDAHRRSVLRNLEYRRLLDAKRHGDWAEVTRQLFSSPETVAYVLSQTLRARISSRMKTAES